MTPRIIVTDGHTRTALAAVRALGRAGFHVAVTAARKTSLAGSSRYARATAVLPRADADPHQFVVSLDSFARSSAAELILPVTDGAISASLRHRETLTASAVVIAPSRAAYDALSDKTELTPLGRAAALAVPRTFHAAPPVRVLAAGDLVGYPCVIKPHRSVVGDRVSMRQVTVSYASDRQQIESVALRYHHTAYPLLIQERIVGPGEGVLMLVDQGTIVCAFAHRRIREFPVTGGASTYRESIAVPPDLREACGRLLASVGWSGAAMVEFKRSQATGEPYLMEVNGRLWGSLKLAIDSGVNFPVLLARLSMGESVKPVESYRTGLRCRWFWGDVNHLIDRLRHSPSELGLPPGTPSRLSLLRDFLTWHPTRDRPEIMAIADPAPWLYETREWLSNAGATVRRRLLRRS